MSIQDKFVTIMLESSHCLNIFNKIIDHIQKNLNRLSTGKQPIQVFFYCVERYVIIIIMIKEDMDDEG